MINNTTKRTTGFNYGEYDKSQREEIASIGGITSKGTTLIKADSYNSVGGILKTDYLALDVNSFNASALSLSGQSTLGISGSNYSKYSETTHFGGGAVTNSAEGGVGNLNLRGSSFIAEDTTGLAVGNVRAESVINTYDIESRPGGFLGGAVAKGISKTIVKNGSNSIYQNYAEKATKNANSTSVMLGKYNQDGISYIKAAGNKHTYFDLGDKGWNEALNKVGESNMWEINKKFLERQLQQGKSFYLSHDPMKASGYFQKEVNFLKDNGFKFIKDGEFWKAVKQ